ncbi:MAG TPA: DUF1257 domain-containing protein [Gemmataceae bacterium]|jgi:hypothetical protein|nr:DUF1257 domain-containing protein [Gemmataceae bacterium]
MSHFSRIKTRMVERQHLLAALRDLGHTPEEGDVKARGFGIGKAKVEIKVPTKSGYDIGFRHTEQGYEVVADWWGVKGTQQKDFLQKLQQRYAYHAARAKLEEQGFTLVSEEQEGGRIRLVLRRMA